MAKATTARAPKICVDCNGWGYIEGHTPMKFCGCVKATVHRRDTAPPKGVKVGIGFGA